MPSATAFTLFVNPFGPGDRVLELHTRILNMSTVDKKELDSLANWTACLTTAYSCPLTAHCPDENSD